jgi:hypothetical protein
MIVNTYFYISHKLWLLKAITRFRKRWKNSIYTIEYIC